MKNVSTGCGLCVLGLGIAAWPILDRLAPSANAGAATAAVAAVGAASTAQAGPTVVWYGTGQWNAIPTVYRAWSNGRIEMTMVAFATFTTSGIGTCYEYSAVRSCSGAKWFVISDPAEGLTYRSDLNFDEQVDGADLGQLLADWGVARRQDVPPSDCPLALINP